MEVLRVFWNRILQQCFKMLPDRPTSSGPQSCKHMCLHSTKQEQPFWQFRAAPRNNKQFLPLQLLLPRDFSPFLRDMIPEVPPLPLMRSALASVRPILEPIWHRGSFQQLLTEVTPVAAPKPKSCHANPIQTQSQRGKKKKKKSILY